MNRYPVWKYVIIAMALVAGALYALPNFFGESPAVQVSGAKPLVKIDVGTLVQVEAALKSAAINPDLVTLDGTSIKVRLSNTEEQLKARGVALLTDRFDNEHEQLFTFRLGDGHEILMIRALVKARSKAIAELKTGRAGTTLEQCRIHESRFYHEGQWHDIVIYDRNILHEGLVVPGPAIVSEMDSTTVVLPGFKARVDAIGNLLINPAK